MVQVEHESDDRVELEASDRAYYRLGWVAQRLRDRLLRGGRERVGHGRLSRCFSLRNAASTAQVTVYGDC